MGMFHRFWDKKKIELKDAENFFQQIEFRLKTTKFTGWESVLASSTLKSVCQLFIIHFFRAFAYLKYELSPYQLMTTYLNQFCCFVHSSTNSLFGVPPELLLSKSLVEEQVDSKQSQMQTIESENLTVWNRSCFVAFQSYLLTSTFHLVDFLFSSTNLVLGHNQNKQTVGQFLAHHFETFVSRLSYAFGIGLFTSIRAYALPFTYYKTYKISLISDLLFILPQILFSNWISTKCKSLVERRITYLMK